MQKNFAQLSKIGTIGDAIFWTRFLILIISLGSIIFSLYWFIITCNKLWVKSIDAVLPVLNIFFFLLSITSFGLVCFFSFIKKSKEPEILSQLYIIITIIAYAFGFMILNQSSSNACNQDYNAVIDYCHRINPNVTDPKDSCYGYQNGYSQRRFVELRTIESFKIFSGFFWPWVILFVFFLLFVAAFPEKKEESFVPAPTDTLAPIVEHDATSSDSDEEDGSIKKSQIRVE